MCAPPDSVESVSLFFLAGPERRIERCRANVAGGPAHHIIKRANAPVTFLEFGDRTPGDEVTYPSDDLEASLTADGTWQLHHKDGRPF
jgi:uncharacterized cupin superfamily protein